eukprot:g70839.t1
MGCCYSSCTSKEGVPQAPPDLESAQTTASERASYISTFSKSLNERRLRRKAAPFTRQGSADCQQLGSGAELSGANCRHSEHSSRASADVFRLGILDF